MLKVSDYLAIAFGFLGILIFYLIFSGNLVLDYGTDARLPFIEREAVEEAEPDTARYVVLTGDTEDQEVSVQIVQMLKKLKLDYITEQSFERLNEEQKAAAEVIIVTGEIPDQSAGQKTLFTFAGEEGKHLFFPSVEIAAGDEACEKELGIEKYGEEIQIDGMILFEGLLIQGMVYYEDYPMEVKNISLDASCTRLIQEKNTEEKEQSELVPLLWKKRYGNGEIYVSNGTLFAEEAGIGVFAGILAEMEEIFAYPVVNSSAVLLDYYPDYEHVNQEMIRRRYSRDPVMYIRDIIWPAMDKIGNEEQLILSGRSYVENKTDDFDDIELQIKRSGGTVLDGQEGLILPYVCEGHLQRDECRYRMESFASGEGLASCYLDMREVTGDVGREAEYEWVAYSLELSKSIHDVYRNNRFLETVNWQEAEERYKRYEKIRPELLVREGEILLSAEGFVDVWYCIVRTEKELLDGQGYEMQKIGDDAYLLEIRQQEIQIPIA